MTSKVGVAHKISHVLTCAVYLAPPPPTVNPGSAPANTVSPSLSMNCGTKNIIYLITCRKCGIQYVGEKGQSLRKRLNKHRNRLKKSSCQYLYQHFNSDGYTEDDISIVPIEEIKLTPTDKISLSAKRLEKEDFWYRELCTVSPSGLNDNVRKVGNVSKLGPSTVVHALFNRQRRKFKKRREKRHWSKMEREVMFEKVDSLLANYKCIDFCFYVHSLQRKNIKTLLALTESLAAFHDIPSRIFLLVKDLIAFKMKSAVMDDACGGGEKKENRGHMTVLFHNKGIEMIDRQKIVHYKSDRKAMARFLNEPPPLVVGYKYARTISSKIFYQKSVVKQLYLDNGTKDMECSCSLSEFFYEPAEHVVTGDFSIIKDAKLRELVNKVPSYRE